jgi:hypothetical protein
MIGECHGPFGFLVLTFACCGVPFNRLTLDSVLLLDMGSL